MSPELTEALNEKYEHLFLRVDAEGRLYPMSFGFKCADGWYQLIDTTLSLISRSSNSDIAYYHSQLERKELFESILSKQYNEEETIETILREYFNVNFSKSSNETKSYFEKLARDLLENGVKVPEEPSPVQITQIKEKFGGLRIYGHEFTDYISGAVTLAEDMSYKLCEVCGSPGTLRTGGWIRTLCDNHAEELNYSSEESSPL